MKILGMMVLVVYLGMVFLMVFGVELYFFDNFDMGSLGSFSEFLWLGNCMFFME